MDTYEVQKLAYEIGFDLCGVTNGATLSALRPILQRRKQSGMQTDIEEEDIERRISPSLLLSDFRSVITVGLSYNFENCSGQSSVFRLSRSSMGTDYHIVMRKLLEELSDKLFKQTGEVFHTSVDTYPLVERELAADSGIGFYGRNCSIIHPIFGSFIFLGEIITTMKLKKTDRQESLCGDCRRCIQACPSGALSEEGLDATRCLSYVTQKKGCLTEREGKIIGNRLYGCDTCQDVCPFNREAKKTDGALFGLRTFSGYDIRKLFCMSNREFQREYGHIAASWRGKNVLKRNAVYNIINAESKEYFDLLKIAERDPNHAVSYAASSANRRK